MVLLVGFPYRTAELCCERDGSLSQYQTLAQATYGVGALPEEGRKCGEELGLGAGATFVSWCFLSADTVTPPDRVNSPACFRRVQATGMHMPHVGTSCFELG